MAALEISDRDQVGEKKEKKEKSVSVVCDNNQGT